MNPVFESLILTGFENTLKGRELPTVEVMPILPIDSRYDPKETDEQFPFPAAGIHPGKSVPRPEDSGGVVVDFDVVVELTLLTQADDLQRAFTLAAKHLMESLMRERRKRDGGVAAGVEIFGHDFIRDLVFLESDTVARDPTAATQTFTRAFTFGVTYHTTYAEIEKYAPIG